VLIHGASLRSDTARDAIDTRGYELWLSAIRRPALTLETRPDPTSAPRQLPVPLLGQVPCSAPLQVT
jgi:hypothetical protein